MVGEDVVGVVARVFATHPKLRQELVNRHANVKFNETGRTLTKDETVAFLKGCSKAIISLETVDEECLSQLPELKVIAKYGVGTDSLDMEALKKHNVRLGWQGGVNRTAVAELALAFALLSIRRIGEANRSLLHNNWEKIQGFQLTGKTVGIIGCGFIGKELVKFLQPFSCQIRVHDIADYPEFYARYGLKNEPLDSLLAQSDLVSLHVPLTQATRNFISVEKLALMKKGAALINTARGSLVDENALKEALKTRHLSAAAFDVFAIEPPLDRELVELPNFFGTPHIGGSSQEAILAMGLAAIEGLDSSVSA